MQTVSRSSAAGQIEQPERDVALQVASQVFDSLRWAKVREGIVQDVSCLDSWKHRTPQDVEADLAYLEINRPDILSALSRYLADASLQTKELDWLFLNILTYAEYTATVSEIRKKLLGIDGYVKSLHPPRAEHQPSVSDIAARPWHHAAAAIIAALSALVHPLLVVAFGAGAIYSYLHRKKVARKINSVLASMLRTYASFNTVDLSWSHVAAELEESRKSGAVWDASLFRLAEVRQRAA